MRGSQLSHALLTVAAFLPALGLVFLAYQMFRSAWPSIVFNGFHFFVGTTFTFGNLYGYGGLVVHHGYKAAPGASYGIAPFVVGTLLASLIALVIAVPVSLGGALLLVEKVPARYQQSLSVFLELLAGIPSVVFGLWGVNTFGPFMARTVYPAIAALHIPWFSGNVGHGEGLATASLVLAVMIVPIIASTTRELVRAVPSVSKEAALGLGLTPSEGVRVVTLPFIRTGVIAASILGWGRALGETIAVLLISGNLLNAFPTNFYPPFSTMASVIAGELDGALTDSSGMAVHALAELGLCLLAITLASNFLGRWISSRFAGTSLPVGRGV